MVDKEKDNKDEKPDRSDYFIATPADFIFSGKGKSEKEE